MLRRHPEGKRILIVDDQVYNIKALKSILHFSFKQDLTMIDSALDGLDAYNKVCDDFVKNNGRSSYDLILMDCNMPFMDGYTSTEFIRNMLYSE
jgi:CheY-like chemotaxis protein